MTDQTNPTALSALCKSVTDDFVVAFKEGHEQQAGIYLATLTGLTMGAHAVGGLPQHQAQQQLKDIDQMRVMMKERFQRQPPSR